MYIYFKRKESKNETPQHFAFIRFSLNVVKVITYFSYSFARLTVHQIILREMFLLKSFSFLVLLSLWCTARLASLKFRYMLLSVLIKNAVLWSTAMNITVFSFNLPKNHNCEHKTNILGKQFVKNTFLFFRNVPLYYSTWNQVFPLLFVDALKGRAGSSLPVNEAFSYLWQLNIRVNWFFFLKS